MPEGDTVWRQARDLHAALAGRVLTRCDLRVPRYATVDFTGRTVDAVRARGKHLLMELGEHVIHSHLMMEGHWDIYPVGADGKSAKWRRPAFTARALLGNDQALAVGFSLGKLEVLAAADVADAVGHLGPDLLGPDWDAAEALRRLASDPARPLGLALLDQRNLAGVGNVFRNELCFLVGAHPATPVGELTAVLPRVVELSKRLLEANKNRSRRSTTGGPAQREAAMWVYRMDGKPCKRCGTLILAGKQAEPAAPTQAPRNIFWCPRCQPAP